MKTFLIILRNCLLIVFSGIVCGLFLIDYFSKNLPSIEQLENYDPDLVTQIISSDGVVLNELFVMKRVFVELDKIPKHMRNAVISSEDKRFYEFNLFFNKAYRFT